MSNTSQNPSSFGLTPEEVDRIGEEALKAKEGAKFLADNLKKIEAESNMPTREELTESIVSEAEGSSLTDFKAEVRKLGERLPPERKSPIYKTSFKPKKVVKDGRAVETEGSEPEDFKLSLEEIQVATDAENKEFRESTKDVGLSGFVSDELTEEEAKAASGVLGRGDDKPIRGLVRPNKIPFQATKTTDDSAAVDNDILPTKVEQEVPFLEKTNKPLNTLGDLSGTKPIETVGGEKLGKKPILLGAGIAAAAIAIGAFFIGSDKPKDIASADEQPDTAKAQTEQRADGLISAASSRDSEIKEPKATVAKTDLDEKAPLVSYVFGLGKTEYSISNGEIIKNGEAIKFSEFKDDIRRIQNIEGFESAAEKATESLEALTSEQIKELRELFKQMKKEAEKSTEEVVKGR